MPSSNRCRDCGTARPSDAPSGLCPICLMKLGLKGERSQYATELAGRSHPPRPEETVIELSPQSLDEVEGTEAVSSRSGLTLLGELARGGMGVILRGRDGQIGRELAVKVLRRRHRDRPDMARRFIDEARITGQLQHPGIVPVYELGELPDQRPYFSMKLVKGKTLAELLDQRDDPMADRSHLLTIFLQVAQTIAYAHSRRVIHRDLKPENIMVGKYGEVQVMDWGLAKVLPALHESPTTDPVADPDTDPGSNTDAVGEAAGESPDAERSKIEAIVGTIAYMSPERFLSQRRHDDERIDVFALGAILFEILTERSIYGDLDPISIRFQAVQGALVPQLEPLWSGDADEALIALTSDCLRTDPAARPRDAGVVAARMSAYLEGMRERLRQAELRRVEAQARAEEERKRRRLTALLAALAIVCALLTLNSLNARQRRTAERRASAALVLRELELLRSEAATDPSGAPAVWEPAQAAAERAGRLLNGAHEGDRARLVRLTTAIERGAERAHSDLRLLKRLEAARRRADGWDHVGADAAFAEAFRQAGYDVASAEPAEIARLIAARPRDVRDDLAAAFTVWAVIRRAVRRANADSPSARSLFQIARVSDPDPWRNQVRSALEAGNVARLRELADAAEPDRQPPPSLWLMGRALFWVGDPARARAFLEEARRVYPEDYWINLDLALFYRIEPSRPGLSLVYASSAVALRPASAVAQARLADALARRGALRGAEAAYREAVRLDPENGQVLAEAAHFFRFVARRLEEALALDRAADGLQPDRAASRAILMTASLRELGWFDEAIATLEEGLEGDPRNASLWAELGTTHALSGDLESARAAFDRAETVAPDGSPQARRVADARGILDELERLPKVLARLPEDRSQAERLDGARLCARLYRGADAARLYAEAFEADPEAVEDRGYSLREQAARAAALAGTDRSVDAPEQSAARAALRAQALEWLRQELGTWTAWIDQDEGRDRRRIVAAQAVYRWFGSPEFAGLREAEGLARLPEDERADWAAFWDEAERRLDTLK